MYLLIQARQTVQAALGRIGLAHIPVGDQLLPVGIGLHIELDRVVQQPHGFRIVAADHLVDHLHQLLRADGLGGMQAAVDPDHGFAFARQRAGLVFCKPLSEGQPAGDLLIPVQIPEVLRRADDRHVLPPALGRGADVDQLHAVGFRGQLLPIRFELGVVGDLVVVAQVEPQGVFGRA